MKGRAIHYSADELGWIKAMSDEPRRETHALFVEIWKRPDVSLSNLNSLCKRMGWMTGRTGQFVKGQPSHNAGKKGLRYAGSEKGWFRKGERSGVAVKLYQPIGTERITKDGYRQRKVNDDMPLQRRWRMVQLIEWEAVNGPLPEGHVLKCLDGDKTNCAPSNWVSIPRAMLPRLNGRFGRDFDAAPAEVKPTLLAIAKLEHAAREAKQGKVA
ncbi:HNH endonuclease [Microcystis phage Mae-JY02]